MTTYFSNNLTTRIYSWSNWKDVLNAKNFSYQYDENEESYTIWGYDDIELYICNIWKNNTPEGISYTQEQNNIDLLDFETNYKSTGNKTIQKKQNGNKALLIAQAAREGNETIYSTHNFCDPTTWFLESKRVTEVLSGSGTVFSGSYPNWIDLNNGKILDEETWKLDIDHQYEVIVIANNITQSMRQPFSDSGGDYITNYRSGTIEFVNDQVYDINQVTASYSRATTSLFTIAPYPYKKLDIEEVKAQFTEDIIMTDAICFDVYGYVQTFAPQYWQENGGPLPTNYKIKLKGRNYKKLHQIFEEAVGPFTPIPAFGGPIRGIQNNLQSVPFRYGTVRTLLDSQGLEIRIYLKNDIPMIGEKISATFYCVSINET